MITTAKRLHIIEEYYFSSKLREVGNWLEGNPIIEWVQINRSQL
jgi:hypothetical protein